MTNQYVSAVENSELLYDKNDDTKYTLYQPKELLEFVSKTQASVFGTAFVTFSGYEYVEFCKNYDLKGIYYIGVNDENVLGYNSILISPEGVNWAKNFSNIVFLSPVLSEGYISEIKKISSANIYLPLNKDNNVNRFASLNLSREYFGKLFSIFASKNNSTFPPSI